MAPSAAAFIDIEQRAERRVVSEQIIAHERREHAVLQQHIAAAVARLAFNSSAEICGSSRRQNAASLI